MSFSCLHVVKLRFVDLRLDGDNCTGGDTINIHDGPSNNDTKIDTNLLCESSADWFCYSTGSNVLLQFSSDGTTFSNNTGFIFEVLFIGMNISLLLIFSKSCEVARCCAVPNINFKVPS